MKGGVLFLITMILAFDLSGQVSYIVSGRIKGVISGTVYLVADISDPKYYFKNKSIDSARINKGLFNIKRRSYDKHTYAYRLIIESDSVTGMSGMVFIEPKNQTILIDSVNEYISPVVPNSVIQHEMHYEYDMLFHEVIREANELDNYADELYEKYKKEIPDKELQKFNSRRKEIIARGDSLFFEYVKKHPDSYVSLWKLIERFKNLGYQAEYSGIFDLLSDRMKKNPTAQLFIKDLKASSILRLNNPFPVLQLKDSSGKDISLQMKNTKAKYTLIDFWFSHCGPCLTQFPKYKMIYDKHKRDGFEIIAISVDRKEKIKDWKKIILEKKLDWTHYLDEDGKQSKKLSIILFPTNYLLNERGEIIKINIIPGELEDFLNKNNSRDNR